MPNASLSFRIIHRQTNQIRTTTTWLMFLKSSKNTSCVLRVYCHLEARSNVKNGFEVLACTPVLERDEPVPTFGRFACLFLAKPKSSFSDPCYQNHMDTVHNSLHYIPDISTQFEIHCSSTVHMVNPLDQDPTVTLTGQHP